MRKLFSALIVGALLLPAAQIVDSGNALAAGPKGHIVKIEERRDSKSQKIQIRRTYDQAGNLIRTTYWVRTPSFGAFAPGRYNKYSDTVYPYFEPHGRNYSR